MKGVAAWILIAALPCGAVLAQPSQPDPGGTAPALRPLATGYAFEQPDVLVRQRLFGLAHGLSLLAAACLDVPEQAGSTQEAYAAWHARQASTIERVVRDLAQYYFAERAGEATWTDLVRALALKEDIREALGEVGLEDACATLPTAIARPRYEFDRLLAESTEAGKPNGAEAAVSPAPTSGPAPAEPSRTAE